jgi:hypothetical protein
MGPDHHHPSPPVQKLQGTPCHERQTVHGVRMMPRNLNRNLGVARPAQPLTTRLARTVTRARARWANRHR